MDNGNKMYIGELEGIIQKQQNKLKAVTAEKTALSGKLKGFTNRLNKLQDTIKLNESELSGFDMKFKTLVKQRESQQMTLKTLETERNYWQYKYKNIYNWICDEAPPRDEYLVQMLLFFQQLHQSIVQKGLRQYIPWYGNLMEELKFKQVEKLSDVIPDNCWILEPSVETEIAVPQSIIDAFEKKRKADSQQNNIRQTQNDGDVDEFKTVNQINEEDIDKEGGNEAESDNEDEDDSESDDDDDLPKDDQQILAKENQRRLAFLQQYR